MPVHTGRLLLSQRDPLQCPDPVALRSGLAAAGFLGAPLPWIAGGYAVGHRFLTLVVFAGCSVQLALEPSAQGDTGFCHIRLVGPYAAPRFLSGRNTRPPRCSSCRKPLRDWLALFAGGGGREIGCPACGVSAAPWGWDWRHQAGWGRFFVQVEEVFPGEATPAPVLMELLAGISGHPWRHFFVQDS